mmetsp:Transcript_88091/g.235695  ORF Transcript_88091/g.235695 Transcript_88091/m.235695 type:complete len:190 (-) Transcript_88091:34-603(-)
MGCMARLAIALTCLAAGGISRLEDRAALMDLMTDYARAVDAKDWRAYLAVFEEEAWVNYEPSGGVSGKVEEVQIWMAKVFTFMGPAQHLLGNFEFYWDEANEDLCIVRCLFHNPVRIWWFPLAQPFFSCGGWYVNRMERKNGLWKIAELNQEMAYNGVFLAVVWWIGVFGCLGLLASRRFWKNTRAKAD